MPYSFAEQDARQAELSFRVGAEAENWQQKIVHKDKGVWRRSHRMAVSL